MEVTLDVDGIEVNVQLEKLVTDDGALKEVFEQNELDELNNE